MDQLPEKSHLASGGGPGNIIEALVKGMRAADRAHRKTPASPRLPDSGPQPAPAPAPAAAAAVAPPAPSAAPWAAPSVCGGGGAKRDVHARFADVTRRAASAAAASRGRAARGGT